MSNILEEIRPDFSASLLAWFSIRYPELTNQMKSCKHNYSDSDINSYHVEDSVWTHTCMALRTAEIMKMSSQIKIALLLHDIGKVFTRKEKEGTNKVHFNSHESVSYFMAGDILDTFSKESGILNSQEKSEILFVIANHRLLFDNDLDIESDKFKNKIGKMDAYVYDLLSFALCDSLGRFTTSPKGNSLTIERYMELYKSCKPTYTSRISEAFSKNLIQDTKPTLTLMIGLPCAGKSHYVSRCRDFHNMETVILSRDVLIKQMGGSRNYDIAWQSVDHKAVDEELLRQFKAYVGAKKNIVLDMTNLSKKGRRKWLSLAPDYTKKAVMLYAGSNETYKRMMSRIELESKSVPVKVINNMMEQFTYPLYDEFDHIYLVEHSNLPSIVLTK